MLFSHAKISSFRAKAHLVFHWCLYNIYPPLEDNFKGADHFTFEAGMGDLALKIEFFPDIELCKNFFPALYAMKDIFSV